MSYDFHPEALAEFESAADFYAECQPGLELRFINAVQAVIARACEPPDRWRILQGEIQTNSGPRIPLCSAVRY